MKGETRSMEKIERSQYLHFSVEGKFIMDLARERYWFEGHKEWALDVIGCLQGMTVDQAMNVLKGDAILSGIDSQTSRIEYTEVIDKKFKDRLAKHLKWVEDKEKREAAEQKEALDKREKRWELLDEARARRDELMTPMPKIEKITDPTLLGKFKVSQKLLEEYVRVYVEHHFQPVGMATLTVSSFLMKMHKRLRESVGLEGYWGSRVGGEPDEFDAALQKICWDEINKDKREFQRKRLARASGEK